MPECRFGAIDQTHFTEEQIVSQIDKALARDPHDKILAFACNWCSYAGADFAGVSRIQYPPNVRIIRTMCSARVSPEWIEEPSSKEPVRCWFPAAIRRIATITTPTSIRPGGWSGSGNGWKNRDQQGPLKAGLGLRGGRRPICKVIQEMAEGLSKLTPKQIQRCSKSWNNPLPRRATCHDTLSKIWKRFTGKISTSAISVPVAPVPARQWRWPPHSVRERPSSNVSISAMTQVVEDERLWLCCTCNVCEDRCPQKIPITDLLVALRNSAARRGNIPDRSEWPSSCWQRPVDP